jgi:hypothetical protein
MIKQNTPDEVIEEIRDEAEIKAPGCAEFLFVFFVATSAA